MNSFKKFITEDKVRFEPMNATEWDAAQKRRDDEMNRKKEAQENEKVTVRARVPERPKRIAGQMNEAEGSHIPGQSKWTPAVKTAHHYQGQINGKTYVVPHSALNIYKKGGYAEPMRHSIVTSLHHVQHNNPDLTPEEHARVHEHIKAIHGGQEKKLHEEHQIGNTVHYRLGHEGHLRIGKVVKLEKEHVWVKRGGFKYRVPHSTIVNSEKLKEEAAIKITTTPATRKELKGARPMRPGAAERFMRRYAAQTELEKKEKLDEGHTMPDGSYKVGTKVTVDGKHGEINHVHHSEGHPKYPHSYKITDTSANDPYKQTRLRGNTFISHNDVKPHLEEGKRVPNPFKVGDKVKLHPEALKHHAQSVPAHAGYTKEGFAWREHLKNLEGHVGTVSHVFPGSGHTNVDFHNGTIGIEHKSLVHHKELQEGRPMRGDVFHHHQTLIAKKTLKMHDAAVAVMGGQTKEEAREHLKKMGWTQKQIHDHEHSLNERALTPAEDAKKEDIVHSMKKNLQGFKDRYGKDAKSVMYATATKQAKELAEQSTHTSNYIDNERTAGKISRRQRFAAASKEKREKAEREEKQLTELNKSTLKSYIGKAAMSGVGHSHEVGHAMGKLAQGGSFGPAKMKIVDFDNKQVARRMIGIKRATDKLEEMHDRRMQGGYEHQHSDYTDYHAWGHVTHGSNDEAKAARDAKAKEWKAQGHRVTKHLTTNQIYDPEGPHTSSGNVYVARKHHAKQLEEAATFMSTYKRNESSNRHTANIVHLAKHFGDAADQAEAKFYHDELKKHGHNMHHEAQYKLHQKLWPKAIAAHSYKEETTMEQEQLVNEETHAYKVHHNGKHIDTVFYGHNEPVEEVKRSLVNHDGYHPDIHVTKERKKRAVAEQSSTLKTVRKVLAEMSTRKHFQMVADLLKANPDVKKRQELANHHADIFAKENPRFDRARFHAAAGTVHGK